MAKRKNNRMTEGKKRIIKWLIEEYDIQSGKDTEDALKNLLGWTIENILKSELDNELVYDEYERNDSNNIKNGCKSKILKSTYGEIAINVTQDRNREFEPKLVKKRLKNISGIEEKIISTYARGLTTRQTSEQIDEMYGFLALESMVSDTTYKLMPGIE